MPFFTQINLTEWPRINLFAHSHIIVLNKGIIVYKPNTGLRAGIAYLMQNN